MSLTYKDQYDTKGYVIVRGLLTQSEIRHYTQQLEMLSGITRENYYNCKESLLTSAQQNALWDRVDGISQISEFWSLIFHKRLLSVVKELLGEKVCYLQHTDLLVGNSNFTWHRDNVHRVLGKGSDWEDSLTPYALVRCAFYLQSYEESHFKLGLIPGSHRANKPVSLATKLSEAWVQIVRKLSYINPSLQKWAKNAEWIKTEPGDCILFDPRLLHSGSSIIGPKYSMILAYGIENVHYYNHYNYYRHMREDLALEDLPTELVTLLKTASLYPQQLPSYAYIPYTYSPSLIHKSVGLTGNKSQLRKNS